MGFVSICIKNISDLTESDLPWLEERISPARRVIFERRKNAKDKIRCCVAEMLLWTGLTELGLDIREYSVWYDEEGREKPMIAWKRGSGEPDEILDDSEMRVTNMMPAGLDFSFSHSGDYVVCAISDAPIGVDVQEETKRGAILSHHVFSEEEMAHITEEDFYWAWTCKEAFIKCASAEHPNLRSAELDLLKMPYPITNRPDADEFYFHTEPLDSRHTLSFCVHTKQDFHYSVLLK